jgi:hypothetical protein
MATRAKSVTSEKGKSASKRTDSARRTGRRTTLRVPRALESEVARTAGELGVSDNEALLRLAQKGAEATQRERSIRRVTGKRRAAVSREHQVGTLPSAEEMQEAILVDRR